MHFIAEPETRVIQKHDIITIIIDENSSTTSSQKLETEKDTSSSANVDAMVSWLKLLELRLEQGDINNVDLIDLATSREFTGEGDYERKDKFTARISAIVREVKPNGTMLVEARKTIARDNEISELVLSGLVREEDITQQNTILSSQMADLRIILENQGDLKKAAEKGLITRVLDTVFAF
jgi:flagellar L-ring protein precursor FlgH